MAINIYVEAQDPPIAGDYTLQQAISQANEITKGSILTLWEDTGSLPAAKQGGLIPHASNTFEVQGGDEAISGSLSAGINYIAATEAGGVITLEWVTSVTGYAYNQAQGGIYNGAGLQLLRDVCYLDGASNIRGMNLGMDYNSYFLSDGSITTAGALNMSGTGASSIGGDLSIDGHISPGTPEAGQIVIASANQTTETLARGIYQFLDFIPVSDTSIVVETQDPSSPGYQRHWIWQEETQTDISIRYRQPLVFSDGVNTQIRRLSASAASNTLNYMKF